ncbi:XXYS1_4_G0011200.mRNA.1.CDS.1 [Saccharomyces cerevisiae]|nr:XXYS1_4_G0011200.mRNA.1.CDS.1 [Saccharomyces cerevisiae]
MSPYMTIPQQYLYISKIRSKLSQCALARHHHRELDLRKMVGHANMLDRILDEIDEIDSEVVLCDVADGSSTAEAHSDSSASSDSSPLTNNIRPISIM